MNLLVSMTSTDDKSETLTLQQLIDLFLTYVTQADEVDNWDDVKSAIESALRYITRASEIAPEDPWIWFQIGWLNYSIRPEIQNTEIAQSAFERALALDPENSIVHLATAFLSQQAGRAEIAEMYLAHGRSISMEGIEWKQDLPAAAVAQIEVSIAKTRNLADQIQQHLVASHWKELLQTVFWGLRPHVISTGIEVSWLPVGLYVDELLLRLEKLGPTVPDSDRLNFYHAIGVELENAYAEPLGLPWYERALQCESDDLTDMFLLHTHLGRDIRYTDRSRRESVAHLLRAYEYLTQLPHLDQWIDYWMGDVIALADWDSGDDLPLFLELIDGALGLVSFNQYGAVLAGAAGDALIKRDRLKEAERYLVQARQWDPRRISVLHSLAFITLEGRRWSEALEYLREVLKNDPNDEDAQRWVPLLEIAADKTTYNASVDSMLGLMTREFGELRSAQDLMMEELTFHRSLIERVGDLQHQAEYVIRREPNVEHAYDDLIQQLHALVQEGAKIQPAAWRTAYNQLVVDLGESVYARLHPDSQHFLQTAEVFLRSGQDTHLTDAAPVSVEYAKVIESELKSQILPEMGICLDTQGFKGRLFADDELVLRGETWKALLGNPRLKMFTIEELFRRTAARDKNGVILSYVQQAGFDAEWLDSLADDLETVRVTYRNGAAHTKRLGWDDLAKFRLLLFKGGLIKRLVELGTALESVNRR
ncbi:MAG: hypothetical protein KDH90_19540 [Anaerolineae bacterium]|nr:hypothetical protein [Anaerolineae bacterium]